jgi:hypothetical protein
MTMDIDSKISQNEIKVEIDLSNELVGLSSSDRKQIKELVGAIAYDSIINDSSRGMSSVTGKKWQGLSDKYKAAKKSRTGRSGADLDLDGDMLGNLRVRNTIKGVLLKVNPGKESIETKKAFNHITGDTLPPRQFLPMKGQDFRPGIMREIRNIIKEFKQEKEDNDTES